VICPFETLNCYKIRWLGGHTEISIKNGWEKLAYLLPFVLFSGLFRLDAFMSVIFFLVFWWCLPIGDGL
jgi:hypothetical protein